jgi:5-methylcytosine-specific restriction protein A
MQQYKCISTPANQPFMFLFIGRVGKQYGYEDWWDANGVFPYKVEV